MINKSRWIISGVIIIIIVGLFSVNLSGVKSQDTPAQRIESNDARVTQTGKWSMQATASASGGSYLFNNPQHPEETALSLEFSGSTLEILYVTGPSLGTLAIEVDGTVLRTVITSDTETRYGQSAIINYLSAEPHTVKVYAQEGGVVAIDAFLIPLPAGEQGLASADEVNDTPANVNDPSSIQSVACSTPNTTHLASVNSSGLAGNDSSSQPALSANGRYIAFESEASDLVAGIDNDGGLADIFVQDRLTCQITLISGPVSGIGTFAGAYYPAISADGRFITFSSSSTNLVSNDANGSTADVFLHDRQTGSSTVVSLSSAGLQGNLNARRSAISADGRFVAFTSEATNLVSPDTNNMDDVFVRDRQLGTTTRVSVTTGGTQGSGGTSPFIFQVGISADGRYVIFQTEATNLVTGDTNNSGDAFVHDRQTATTSRVSVGSGGIQAPAGGFSSSISANGRFVAFSTVSSLVVEDTNGVQDVYVHDRETGITTRASVATGGAQASNGPSTNSATISADGRFVAFSSDTNNLVTGDTNNRADIFVHDRQTLTTTRLSVSPAGTQSSEISFGSTISADGRIVAFVSYDALVAEDSNSFSDIYVSANFPTQPDTLALFRPAFQFAATLDTLNDAPSASAYTAFSVNVPLTNEQWVMGDWDGNGTKTPGVYGTGSFYFTNDLGETENWQHLNIGLGASPVVGRFSSVATHDCIGTVRGKIVNGNTVFNLNFTCDFANPTFTTHALGAVLPTSEDVTGPYQFGAGDFDNDGLDSIAVRRGTSIAVSNVPPANGNAVFEITQLFGAPGAGDEGIFVVGDWDGNRMDSFGLFYQNGEFFYRNDLQFNSGVYANQSIGTPFGNIGVQATAWH